MSEAPKAVFLSYASQDAEAVARIAEALRAKGVEVWFDKDELVGGDAWDAKIRGQIASCALFVPVISAATQARGEGYFRLEWKLAVDRSHLMAHDQPFLLPIVVDATADAAARVPPEFRAVQWTRLPGGETPEKFCARVKTLLGGEGRDAAPRRPSAESDPRHGRLGETSLPVYPVRRSWLVPMILGGVVALGALAWWQPWRETAPTRPTPASVTSKPSGPAPAPVVNDKSLVVLPLENLSPDPENAFFTDGMHAEIIATLQRTTDLRVIGRDSALTFKRGSTTVAEFAQRVGAVNIITGSVRRAGIKVRIQLELRRASDDALLWSSPSSERELTDIWAVQSEIADQVARVLQAREAGGVIDAARFRTKNTQAYDLFLKQQATFFEGLNTRQSRNFEEAIRIGKEAFKLDPSFMPAAGFVSVANALLYATTSDPARRATYATESKQWAEVASRLVPGGAGDLAMISHLYYIERDFVRAASMAENGVRAMPSDSGLMNFLGLARAALGRTAEAAENFQSAVTADPMIPVLSSNLLQKLVDLRRKAPALAVIARLETLPNKSDHRWIIAENRFRLLGEIPSELNGLDEAEWLWRGRQYDRLAGSIERQLAQQSPSDTARFSLQLRLSDARRRQGDLVRAAEAARMALALAEGYRSDQTYPIHGREMRVAESLVRLDRFDEAVGTAQRAVDAAPEKSDLLARWRCEVELAAVCAQAGRNQQCIELLAKLLRVPSGLTVPMLKVDPTWDNVREDAAFKALLADPKNSAPL